jgi:hypothetical protein
MARAIDCLPTKKLSMKCTSVEFIFYFLLLLLHFKKFFLEKERKVLGVIDFRSFTLDTLYIFEISLIDDRQKSYM